MSDTFTLIVEGTPVEKPARWAELEPLAARLERPLATDPDERAAFLGVSARARAARLASLEAPDFTLPDLEGRPHSLAEHRGCKVFLVAYGSW
jgi:hypothetical protein